MKLSDWYSAGGHLPEMKEGGAIKNVPDNPLLNINHLMSVAGIPDKKAAKRLKHVKAREVKKAEGGKIYPAASMGGDVFVNAAMQAGLPTDTQTLNKIVVLVNKGMSPTEAARAVASSETKMADGGEANLAPYGVRHSGEGIKGKGYFGPLQGAGGISTEISAEDDSGEFPLLVPTLTAEEVQLLLAGGQPTESIYRKAAEYARMRRESGKSPFAGPTELRYPPPTDEVKMGVGGIAKAIKGLTAAEAAAQEAKALKKASEVFGKHEGKTLMITEADRTKVGQGFLGGPGFSGLQHVYPAYRDANAAWGVASPSKASTIVSANARVPEGQAIWAPMLGSPTQHKSNQMVFDQILNKFRRAAKDGKLDPELRATINNALASAVDKSTGNNIFPPDVDIMAKNFRSLASTFDRRALAADIMGGIGVGGKKGMIIDYPEIIRSTTDPVVIDSPVGAIGNRAFTLSGEVGFHPELHPAFPHILKGEDLGEVYTPIPRDLALRDFVEQRSAAGKKPTVWAFTRGHGPTQFISEDWLTNLQKYGYAEGGEVHMAEGGQAFPLQEDLQAEIERLRKRPRTRAGVPVEDTNVVGGALKGLGETLLGAGRGAVAATLGAPADILNLLNVKSMGTPDIPYGSEYFKEKLPFAPQTQTGKTAQSLGEFLPIDPRKPATAAMAGAKRLGTELAPTAADILESQLTKSGLMMPVIKPEGGNWLNKTTESYLQPLRFEGAQAPETFPEWNKEGAKAATAINNFVDKKLTKYLRNEMGTPSDPVRIQADEWAEKQSKLLADKQAQIDKARADMEKVRQERNVNPEVLTRSQARIRQLEKERSLIQNRIGLHFEPRESEAAAERHRKAAGQPVEPQAKTDIARKWENMSDRVIRGGTYQEHVPLVDSDIYDQLKSRPTEEFVSVLRQLNNESLEKIGGKFALENPEAFAYKADKGIPPYELGLDHLTDELSNAMDPSSGLPKELLLEPKTLDKMNVAQAIEHVDKINAWRASQKAEANKARAANIATVTHKEYPEAGLKWVEIKMPELVEGFKVPERYEIKKPTPSAETFAIWDKEKNQYVTSGLKSEEDAAKHVHTIINKNALEDALKYEGEVLKHCVGKYCNDVVSGESRIFSLRDEEGLPHATIEVNPNTIEETMRKLPDAERQSLAQEVKDTYFGGVMPGSRDEKRFWDLLDEAYVKKYGSPPPKIKQIKGELNRAPQNEVLPFVQDFVKSGDWTDVGDLRNTGLVKVSQGQKLPGFSKEITPGYYTIDELKQIAIENDMPEEILESWMNKLKDISKYGYAKGGAVQMARGGSAKKPTSLSEWYRGGHHLPN